MLPENVKRMLADAQAKGATDIHICAGAPVMYRIGRELIPGTRESLTPEMSRKLALGLLTDKQHSDFVEAHDIDVMLADGDGRFRVNVSQNNGQVGAVIRVLAARPPTIESLVLPAITGHFTRLSKGLVLITGATSQGKTTTMSAMIDDINENERKHIVTIEDPIEYVHVSKKSVVRQREVGADTRSFAVGLRAALRQDPDVIAIGEMRDYETIKIALTAAETGVLVYSTLHIISIDKMIERLLSYSPPEEERHIRFMLANCLQGVIHQELLETVDGGKRVACEVLVTNDAARSVIRKTGASQLRNVLTTGAQYGMITMTKSIEALRQEGVINPALAMSVQGNYSL